MLNEVKHLARTARVLNQPNEASEMLHFVQHDSRF